MPRCEELSTRSTLWEGKRCSVIITKLRPGNLLITLYGYNDGEIGDPVYAAMNAEIDEVGYVNVFMDTREQIGIAAKERERAITWAASKATNTTGICSSAPSCSRWRSRWATW
jgi:hypothetical protein